MKDLTQSTDRIHRRFPEIYNSTRQIKQLPGPKLQTCLLNIQMFRLSIPGKEKYVDPYVYACF